MKKANLNTVGEYKIEGELGQGSRSIVYRAIHMATRQSVALKILNPGSEDPDKFRERIRWGLNPYSQLTHPNLLKTQEILDYEQTVCLMDLVLEQPLSKQMMQLKSIDLPQILYIILQVVSVISALHDKALFHGGIRPGNIFVEPNLNWKVSVSDPGLFLLIESEQPGFPSSASLSVLPYLAPEQIQSPVKIDHRTDIYAVGVLLFELVTGVLPFQEKSVPNLLVKIATENVQFPDKLKRDLPEEVEYIILKCLEKDRNKRFSHINQMALAIEDLYRRLTQDTLTESEPDEKEERPEGVEEACLVKLNEQPASVFRLPLQSEMIIGRSNEAIIRLISEKDLDVSRKHAQIDYEEGQFFIKDLGSQNGIYVNQERVASYKSVLLQPMDQIQIGKNVFQFTYRVLSSTFDESNDFSQEKL